MNTNVKSGWELSKLVHTYIPKGGSIIFIGSGVAYTPGPPSCLYSITKTLLLGLVIALSKELGSRGIRVNSIQPGFCETELMLKNPQIYTPYLSMFALGKISTLEEIGGTAAFLASDDAGNITGENVIVNGGFTVRL